MSSFLVLNSVNLRSCLLTAMLTFVSGVQCFLPWVLPLTTCSPNQTQSDETNHMLVEVCLKEFSAAFTWWSETACTRVRATCYVELEGVSTSADCDSVRNVRPYEAKLRARKSTGGHSWSLILLWAHKRRWPRWEYEHFDQLFSSLVWILAAWQSEDCVTRDFNMMSSIPLCKSHPWL